MKENQEKTSEKCEQIHSLEVNLLTPNPNQPRKVFSSESIIKLADSIRQFGIIQPLTVRKIDGGYELVAGERRLRAAKELGMRCVPCIIVNASEERSAEISIIENLLREDLNIFEQAMAIEALIDTYGLTQEQIAEKLCASQSFVANKLRLLRLRAEEREKILENKLTERHARALLRVLDPDMRLRLLDKIISEGLNVSKSEELIDAYLELTPSKKQKSAPYQSVESLYSAINRILDGVRSQGIKVKSRKIENDNYTELTILIPKGENAPISSENAEFELVSSLK